MPKKLLVLELGQMDYQECRKIQLELQAKRQRGLLSDILVLTEHPPTLTVGKSGGMEYILASDKQLKQNGISVYAVERGGSVTYHGPGQLVAYPIIDLAHREKDIHLYIYQLEEVVIRLLRHFGINSGRRDELRGVWVDSSKIMAVGVAVSKWVTMHGIALNVNPNLNHFNLIIPCGLLNSGVTSIAKERTALKQTVPSYEEIVKLYQQEFSSVFEYFLEPVNLAELQVEKYEELSQQIS